MSTDTLHIYSIDVARAMTREILTRALSFSWTLQGFGMLRLHMTDEFRLNIWDSRYKVPNVSLVHTHPWDFQSLIVAGILNNVKMEETDSSEGLLHGKAVIKPGPGGGMLGYTSDVYLRFSDTQRLRTGNLYRQTAAEIHVSHPEDGTITLNRRRRVGDDLAFVYWKRPGEGVSAEPREATAEEILNITSNALTNF